MGTIAAATIVSSFVVIAFVLSQVQSRIALVEVLLTEGLPPGLRTAQRGPSAPATETASLLGPGVHVFVSRSCHACQRLADEMATIGPDRLAAPRLHYIDRPRAGVREALSEAGFVVDELRNELAVRIGAEPLPFTVAVGPHGMVTHGVTPTVEAVRTVAAQAAASPR